MNECLRGYSKGSRGSVTSVSKAMILSCWYLKGSIHNPPPLPTWVQDQLGDAAIVQKEIKRPLQIRIQLGQREWPNGLLKRNSELDWFTHLTRLIHSPSQSCCGQRPSSSIRGRAWKTESKAEQKKMEKSWGVQSPLSPISLIRAVASPLLGQLGGMGWGWGGNQVFDFYGGLSSREETSGMGVSVLPLTLVFSSSVS